MVMDSEQRRSHLSGTCPSPHPPDSVSSSDPWSGHAVHSFSDCRTRVASYFILCSSDQTKEQYRNSDYKDMVWKNVSEELNVEDVHIQLDMLGTLNFILQEARQWSMEEEQSTIVESLTAKSSEHIIISKRMQAEGPNLVGPFSNFLKLQEVKKVSKWIAELLG
ncbi:hypothetical protein JTB14_007139 [Gonioctena quinquepunctata]|nr:hypothetical protein JTB14_007139 [Gonioctena quinquepunctata]